MQFKKKNIGKIWAFHYFLSLVIITAAVLLLRPLAATESYHVVSFILLFIVSILGTFMGTGPVLLASTLSALFWNFFFIPPNFTFHIDRTEDILIFGLFFIIALLNGVLTTRLRNQEKLVRDRERRTNALFQLTQELSKASGIGEVLKSAVEEIKKHFQAESFFILQDGENLLNKASATRELTDPEYKTAEWVFINRKPAGAFTLNPFDSAITYYPLNGAKVNPGVAAVKLNEPFTGEQLSYWYTFLSQIANALEREFLGEMAQRVRFLDESDRLYKTLFNSISHELRIPVATIMGASDSIIHSENQVTGTHLALCNEIFTASLRLNRLIENLLNISRLESGHISARLDWYDVNDLVNKVLNDLTDELKPFNLVTDVGDDMPLVKIDFGLMEQVLYNLLVNAAQYAPPASEIFLSISYSNETMIIKVSDQGPGFPEKEIRHAFRKFYRAGNNKTGGLGLGLSIAKGFVEAHGGRVSVENKKRGGALFTLHIPSETPKTINIQEPDYE